MVKSTLVKEPNVFAPFRNGIANRATFVIGAEASNAIPVTIQLFDGYQEVGERVALTAYLSTDANGDTVTALATPTFSSGTDGVVTTLVAGKYFAVTSEADGDIDLIITYTTGAGTVYLVLIMPDGSLVVSGAIAFI